MSRRTLIVLLGGIALLIVAAVFYTGAILLRGRQPGHALEPQKITLCDLDASGVCVISFGTDSRNQLVINLHLPDEDYPPFQARVDYRGESLPYKCQNVDAVPSNAYCTGERPPLGAMILLRLLSVEDNELLAEGKLAVRAVALATFSNGTLAAPSDQVTAAPAVTLPAVTASSTPFSAYPNPTLLLPTTTPTSPSGYPGGYP